MNDAIMSESDAEDSQDSSVKIYANASTLEVDGTPPSVGDEVSLTVKGTVDSVDGDVVCVKPTEVNGQPAPEAPDASSDSTPDDMNAQRDQLAQGAQSDDNNSSYA